MCMGRGFGHRYSGMTLLSCDTDEQIERKKKLSCVEQTHSCRVAQEKTWAEWPQIDFSSLPPPPMPGWLSQTLSHLVSKSICFLLPLGAHLQNFSYLKPVIFSGRNFMTIPVRKYSPLPSYIQPQKAMVLFHVVLLKDIAGLFRHQIFSYFYPHTAEEKVWL